LRGSTVSSGALPPRLTVRLRSCGLRWSGWRLFVGSYEAALAGPDGSRKVAKQFGVSKSKVNYDRAKLREAQFLATQGGAIVGDIDGLVNEEHGAEGSSYTLTSERAWGFEDFRNFIRSRGQDPDSVDFEWGVTTNPNGGFWNRI